MMLEKKNFALACSLLSQMVKEKRNFGDQIAINGNGNRPTPTTLSLLPGVDVSVDGNETETDSSGCGEQPEKSPLTIFYNGKVLVFDDFPEEKVKDLMQLATDGSSTAASPVADRLCQSTLATLPATKPNQTNSPDLLAQTRRASLHRFLNKRKERINAKAPYQVNGSTKMAAVTEPEETRSWLGLGQERWQN